jgi:short subunit dehydrogenase-like uncharacterized protein
MEESRPTGRPPRWMIYGATGYTGELVAREAVRRRLAPILAGRSAPAVEKLAGELGLEARVFALDDLHTPRQAAAALGGVAAVLHCAGPFVRTSAAMVQACLAGRVHYLDITGEIEVFEAVLAQGPAAREAGIVLLPGAGFDVVPSDCLASRLADALPGATELDLAFTAGHRSQARVSRGTMKTMIESLPHAGAVRRAGRIVAVPIAYDVREIAALTRFQVTHGLAATSPTVDAATLAALNVPIADRIREIELNLERWRWTTGDLGSRYVLVNIPEFQLSVIEDGNVVLTMNVIVGKVHQQTPVFSDLMTQIVLNPSWHIPDSIAAAEVAPALLRDPGYLRRKGYEIRRSNGAAGAEFAANELGEAEINQLGKHGSPFRLVQPPGADNALGRYKFVFPNQFDVYLHDTPSGRLFARSERDFSHGCIRLEKPAELATYLLDGDPQWPPEAVEEAVDSGRTVTIPLRRPLPVHLLYQTTWVDPDGTLQFRPDVYRHDSWLDAALTGESPLWDDLAALRR